MKIEKEGSAAWQGTLKEGGGTVSTQSGVLNLVPYGFNTRFEDTPGTNPEELLGASHASCFTMALSLILGENGFIAETLETKASVSLEKIEDAYEISSIHLKLIGKVPGIKQVKFQELANRAKEDCPISKALSAPITLEAELLMENLSASL